MIALFGISIPFFCYVLSTYNLNYELSIPYYIQ